MSEELVKIVVVKYYTINNRFHIHSKLKKNHRNKNSNYLQVFVGILWRYQINGFLLLLGLYFQYKNISKNNNEFNMNIQKKLSFFSQINKAC